MLHLLLDSAGEKSTIEKNTPELDAYLVNKSIASFSVIENYLVNKSIASFSVIENLLLFYAQKDRDKQYWIYDLEERKILKKE